MKHAAIEEETETLRQLVIQARENPKVEAAAEACLARLTAMHAKSPELFTEEDARFLNMLRGTLGVRLESHKEGGPYEKIAKPKGVKLDHCWRCETPLDSRFTEVCPECSTKTSRSLKCPVCKACGCQKAGGTVLV